MKIKQVIKETGLTDRAIRLYIENELVKPECDENYNGRKSIEFSETDVENLKNIALLRKADFSIQEIKDLQMGGETAQNTIKEYINRTNEKIQFNSEIIEKIGTLADEENITIEIICEKLSSNLINEQVPAEDMELSPKEQKEKNVFTAISVTGMVLAGITILLLQFVIASLDYNFPVSGFKVGIVEGHIIDSIFTSFLVLFIKYFFIIQFALCLAIYIIYRIKRKISKKKDKKKVVAIILVVFWVVSLVATPFIFMLNVIAMESCTENPRDYLYTEGSFIRYYDKEEKFDPLFPDTVPTIPNWEETFLGEKYHDTTKYYYKYADGWEGFSEDVFAEWVLNEDELQQEKERVLNLEGIVREESVGDWTRIYFTDEVNKRPSTEHCEYYCFLFFAYNDQTNTVRYVFAEGEEEYTYTPYFTDVDW